MNNSNGRPRGSFEFRDFDPQSDTKEFLLDHLNEALNPSTTKNAVVRVRLSGLTATIDLEKSDSTPNRVFRLTLGRSAFDGDGSFHPLISDDVRRWRYLRNRLKDAERITRAQFLAALRAGSMSRVTQAQLTSAGFPTNAFDLIKNEPNNPTIWTDAYGSGIRYVYGADLLRWFESLGETHPNGYVNGRQR